MNMKQKCRKLNDLRVLLLLWLPGSEVRRSCRSSSCSCSLSTWLSAKQPLFHAEDSFGFTSCLGSLKQSFQTCGDMEKHLGWSWQGFPPTQNFLLRFASYTLAFGKLHIDEVSVGKQNLNHVEPVFDTLVPTKIEFSVLEILLVEIPFWQNPKLMLHED